MSISFLRHGAAGLFPCRTGRTARRRARHFRPATTEGLEKRLAMSCRRRPAIQMLSATTTDSKSVTIEYQVNQAPDASKPDPVRRLSFQQWPVQLERFAGRHGHAGRPRHGSQGKVP